MLEGETSCPRWIAHHAFAQPGRLLVQQVALTDGAGQVSNWLTLAQTVKPSAALGADDAQFVVVLGLEAALSGQLAQARGHSLSPETATPLGPGCGGCHHANCLQRSHPPRGTALMFDDRSRGLTPFDFAG